jgi:type IV pilus assembly protein PilM
VIKRFVKRYRSLLGVDLNASFMKTIALSQRGFTHVVDHCTYQSFPGCPEAVHASKVEMLSAHLKKIATTLPPLKKGLAFAIPDSAIFSKTIQCIPGLTALEREELVWLEVKKQFANEAVHLDFTDLGPSHGHPGMVDVKLIASESETVNTLITLSAMAGLKAKVIETESHAVARVVSQLLAKELANGGKDCPIAVVQINALELKLFLVEEGRVVHFAQQAVEPAWGGRDAQILLLIQECAQMVSRNNPLQHIFLGGEMQYVSKTPQRIEKETGIPTTIANPFKYLDFDNRQRQKLAHLSPEFLIACGLALRE